MARYTVTARFTPEKPLGAGRTEALLDVFAGALLDQPDLIDPDVGANLSEGWLDVTTMVDADDEVLALSIVARSLRRTMDDLRRGDNARLRVDVQPAALASA